jgi:lysophospholipid acyltransferase (LPLAT)-like uncharacterized protein
MTWADPVVAGAGATIVRVLAGTWRYDVRGWENVEAARASGRPIVYVTWHSRLLPVIHFMHRRHVGMALLISRHRDGGYLADLCEHWGFRTVRGSTQRGGVAGLLGLVRYLRAGTEVGTTPDGPRGPAEEVKPGIVAAAQHADAHVIAISARAHRAWWIRSWDRLCVPKPYAKVQVFYSPPLEIAPGKPGLRAGVAAVERALQAVTYGGQPADGGASESEDGA